MSTRGAYGFRLDGRDYIQYNHSDSYPSGLGADILNQSKALAKMPAVSLRNKVASIRLHDGKTPPTANDIALLAPWTNLGVGQGSVSDWYCLTRNMQGDLLAHLKAGLIFDSRGFLKDSLFCEWAYIVNVDTRQLECYQGFNKSPNGAGRYASLRDGDYYGVRLVRTYPLGRLPSLERFLKELKD